MNLIEKKKELSKYPLIKSEIIKTENYECICVASSEPGFVVSLYLYKDGEFQVSGNGWRYAAEELGKEEDAIRKFLYAYLTN